MMSNTVSEPLDDIEGQLAALADPEHVKRSVFIPHNSHIVLTRPEGTLITSDLHMARYFATAVKITDDDMAVILGYPEKKSDVIASGGGVMVQAVDDEGRVIVEAVASHAHLDRTVAAFSDQGNVRILTPQDAITRRIGS